MDEEGCLVVVQRLPSIRIIIIFVFDLVVLRMIKDVILLYWPLDLLSAVVAVDHDSRDAAIGLTRKEPKNGRYLFGAH